MDDAPATARHGHDGPAATVGRGMVMGLADVVPGVSGGTMALLLGIYDRFIHGLASLHPRLVGLLLACRSKEGREAFGAYARRTDLLFLVQLALGIGVAIVLGAHVLGELLERYPRAMMAVFFGLILASTRIPWRRIERPGIPHAIWLVAGTAIAAATVLLPANEETLGLPFLFLAGALAITAMILPGISGSALLVLVGAYERVIDAVRALDLVVLGVFAGGALGGLLASSRGIRWLLSNHGAPTMAALTGLMLGSLVRVWPWRDAPGFGEGLPVAPDAASWLVPAALILAGLLVSVGLERLAGRRSPVAAPV